MIIVQLIAFLLMLSFYYKRQYAKYLFMISVFFTGFYNIVDVSSSPVKNIDFLNLSTIIVLLCDKVKYIAKSNLLRKITNILLLFLFLSFLSTILFDKDTFGYAFKVFRGFFPLLLIFVVQKIPQKQVEDFFQLYFYVAFCVGILFYLQMLGVNILSGRVVEGFGNSRFQNYPPFCSFIIAYVYLSNAFSLMKKLFYMAFFFGMLILGQERGMIMGLAFGFVVYTICQKNFKRAVLLAFVGGCAYFAIQPMLAKRSEQGNGGMLSDIQAAFSLKNSYDFEAGSFAFRTAMLMERAEYLNSHPGDALLGVGMIHEESNHNKFSFRLGTMNSSFKYGRCMIESNDIAWCPILLRFGYIGVMLFFLYLLIIVMVCNSLIKSCDNKNVYLDSIMIYMISVLILTFNAGYFERIHEISMLAIFVGYLISIKNDEKVNNLFKLEQAGH